MFLICISEVLDVIEHFLCIIQNNSVFIGIITSIIVGARWFRKYIEQKRAEAFLVSMQSFICVLEPCEQD